MEPAEAPVAPASDFEGFYRDTYPSAVRLAWLLTHDGGAAEDIVQDAFGRLHARFATVERPHAYLRVAVVNGCRERRRRHARDERRLRLVTAASDISVAPPTEPLVDALGRLPYRQRAALVLRYWADASEADIAEAIGVRPSTVRSLVARGLDALRKEIPR